MLHQFMHDLNLLLRKKKRNSNVIFFVRNIRMMNFIISKCGTMDSKNLKKKSVSFYKEEKDTTWKPR